MAKPAVKRKAPARTTPRVTHDEGSRRPRPKSAEHKQGPATKPDTQAVLSLLDGELFISAQLSEVAPTGQFAGVTVGPVTLAYKLGGVNMEELIGVEWPDDLNADVELTEEQAEVFDRVFAAVQGPLRLIAAVISTDRTAVEQSVRTMNKREDEEKERKDRSKSSKKPAANKPKPRIGRK